MQVPRLEWTAHCPKRRHTISAPPHVDSIAQNRQNAKVAVVEQIRRKCDDKSGLNIGVFDFYIAVVEELDFIRAASRLRVAPARAPFTATVRKTKLPPSKSLAPI